MKFIFAIFFIISSQPLRLHKAQMLHARQIRFRVICRSFKGENFSCLQQYLSVTFHHCIFSSSSYTEFIENKQDDEIALKVGKFIRLQRNVLASEIRNMRYARSLCGNSQKIGFIVKIESFFPKEIYFFENLWLLWKIEVEMMFLLDNFDVFFSSWKLVY